jgi:hypothetical protein
LKPEWWGEPVVQVPPERKPVIREDDDDDDDDDKAYFILKIRDKQLVTH